MNTTMKPIKARVLNTIMHNGKRKVCRIFDAGEQHLDRYTVAFKGYRSKRYGMVYPYLACSVSPYHGFGQRGESEWFFTGKHLGKRVSFESLNDDVKRFILSNI